MQLNKIFGFFVILMILVFISSHSLISANLITSSSFSQNIDDNSSFVLVSSSNNNDSTGSANSNLKEVNNNELTNDSSNNNLSNNNSNSNLSNSNKVDVKDKSKETSKIIDKDNSNNNSSNNFNTKYNTNNLKSIITSHNISSDFLVSYKTNTSLVSKKEVVNNNFFSFNNFSNFSNLNLFSGLTLKPSSTFNFFKISNLSNTSSLEDVNNSFDSNIDLALNPLSFIEPTPHINRLPLENDLLFPPESIVSRLDYISDLKSLSNTRESYNLSESSVENLLGTAPTTGTVKIPVLLVDFPDHPSTLSSSLFEDMFNSDSYLDTDAISVSHYYDIQSYGSLDLEFDIYGWETLSTNYSYYVQNNATQFELIIDAINHFDSQVDFSEYDSDDNGRLDGVMVIRSGTNTTSSIPDQTRILKAYNENMVDGKYLGNATLTSEKLNSSDCGYYQSEYNYPSDCRSTIIIPTHELGHVFGLPDLYPIHPTTHMPQGMGVNGKGLGILSMMTTDLEPLKPVNLDVWSRFFLGWVSPTYIGTFSGPFSEHEDLCTSSQQSLRSFNDHSDSIIVSNSDYLSPREFFIMSHRYIDICESNPDPYNLDNGMDVVYCGSSDWDSSHIGLDIYHIDEEYIEDNYVNNSIMYDEDGEYWTDDTYHPGIVFERQFYNSGGSLLSVGDFYSDSTLLGYVLDTFDKNNTPVYVPEPFNIYFTPSHSNSYSGIENTRIAVKALDYDSYDMGVKVEWQKCYAEDNPTCSQLNVSNYCPMEE